MGDDAIDQALAGRILDQMADAMIFADAEGIVREWNRAAERLFGFARDAAVGRSLDIVIPERLREPHWKGYRAAMAAGRGRLDGRPTPTKALRADGGKCLVEMSFAVVTGADGKAIGAVAVARSGPPTP
ncbi:MAG: PAS domain S-box protein [Rhodocyclaceae bacterium]|nr:PAS domain S-box protein [Rhodocyclaceae bacterium]